MMKAYLAPLQLLQQWIDTVEVRDPAIAHLICKCIPSRCPFERRIQLWNGRQLRIPALCKLNPLYAQLTMLRLRSVHYLFEIQPESPSLPQEF